MALPCQRPLAEAGRLALARALGESPETVIAVHHLRRGSCRAWAAGEPAHFRAAVLLRDNMPAEATAYGSDAAAVWELLQVVKGWDYVNVGGDVAADVGWAIAAATGRPVRHYGDVYHVLLDPPARAHSDAVHRLTLGDLDLFKAAAGDFSISEFGGPAAAGSPKAVLEEGCAAGAIVEGRLVGLVQTSAMSEGFADIGAFTAEGCRGKGYSTAAAAIVCRWVRRSGRIPVWSCGEDNLASLRVARKLGFCEVSRRVYLVPERPEG